MVMFLLNCSLFPEKTFLTLEIAVTYPMTSVMGKEYSEFVKYARDIAKCSTYFLIAKDMLHT